MPSKRIFYYWDSCVFLAYLNKEENRAKNIKAVLEFVSRHKEIEIITSTMAIAEVVKAKHEVNSLDPSVEINIKEFWYNWDVKLADMTPVILASARDLMRDAVTKNIQGLKPPDAIHLATAMWVERNLGILKEIHTYEDRWASRFSGLLNGLVVCEPSPPPSVL